MDNETATLAPEVNNAHFPAPMQDITDRLESKLFDGPEQSKPDEIDDDAVSKDELALPGDDNADPEDDEGLDLDEIANEEELSLAEYLGIDEERLVVDEDGNTAFNSIVDGKTTVTPLKDLVSSYQLQGHVNNKSIALEAERKEFEADRTKAAEELGGRIDEAKGLAKMLEDSLVGDYNSVDWDRLRVENPSEWSALRQEFSEKAGSIQAAKENIQSEAQRLFDENQNANMAKRSEYMQGQNQKLVAANPTWVDDVVRKADMDSMKEFLGSAYGYAEDDLNGVTDHRLIAVFQDAKKYREGTQMAEDKKQKKVPKFRKPGAAKANANQLSKARSIKANKKAVRDTGGHTSAIAASILDRM